MRQPRALQRSRADRNPRAEPTRRTNPAGWFGADRPVFSLKRWADQCAEQLDDRRLPGVREPG